MRFTRTTGALALAIALGACSDSEFANPTGPDPRTPPPDNALTFDWRGAVEPGDRVEIRGVLGDIRVVSGAVGSDVEVFAEKSWGRTDPAGVTFEVVRHSGGVTICAVYPHPDGGRNECRPGGGSVQVGENDVAVTFDVRLPPDVNLITATVDGSLDARGLGGDVTAATVVGDLMIETSGLAEAATVGGNITASIGRSTWHRDLSFAAVNGRIVLELPATTNADVTVTTVTGRILTDFTLAVEGQGRRAAGTLGAGGRHLDVATVNGDVELRRRP